MKKGFTLIELLVVIAIIGILASVVLASLNTARGKGADSAIKADLSGVRATAEVVYDNLGLSYNTGTAIADTTCVGNTTANSILADTSIQNAITHAAGLGVNGASAATTAGDATCNVTSSAYAISVRLKTSGWWCVDSTGNSRANAATLGTATVCPAS
jgi:prepilin-type N-terminal cleavage/methylation domain-containing protein